MEHLLGASCYHMSEVFRHPEHVDRWSAAAAGDVKAIEGVLEGYAACVDWPAAAFWQHLANEHQEAVVLLSTRRSAADWWDSCTATIFANLVEPPDEWKQKRPERASWRDMWEALASGTFTDRYLDRSSAMAAYEAHNASVRLNADTRTLVEWQPGDGWAPLCGALNLPEPSDPFPHLNSTDDWRNGRV